MNPRSNPRSTVVANGDLMKCQEAIGYLFRRDGLLRKALTHSSVKDDLHPSNERLEFLGDAILGMVISEYLFSLLPGNDEGDLTRVKSVVVSGESLSRLGFEMGLDKFLFIGKGLRMKGEVPRSLIANVVEAVIAAVYLDRGMEAARHFVLDHLHHYVQDVLKDDHVEKNFKSMLQQRAQKEFSATPVYRVLQERGPDHSKLFRVAAVVKNREFTAGKGASKKEAEQDAAKTALEILEKEGRGRSGRGSGRRGSRSDRLEPRAEPAKEVVEQKPARSRGRRSPRAEPPEEVTAPPARKGSARTAARTDAEERQPAPAAAKGRRPAAKKPRPAAEGRPASDDTGGGRKAPARVKTGAESPETPAETTEKRKPRRRRPRSSAGSR